MTTTTKKRKTASESLVREIKRKTRRKFTAEEKIRIVLDGLRGRQALPISAEGKAFIPPSTTNGAKCSWRQVNAGSTGTRFEKPDRMRSRDFEKKTMI